MRRLLIPATVLACLSLTACQGSDEPSPSGSGSSAASTSPSASASASPAVGYYDKHYAQQKELVDAALGLNRPRARKAG